MAVERSAIPHWECSALLHEQRIGRLCIVDSGYPIAVPVNFRFVSEGVDAKIVVRVGNDTMLGRYEGLASLECDHLDLVQGQAWSIIARGSLRRVIGSHNLIDPEPLLDNRHRWLTLQIAVLSGRRFEFAPTIDGHLLDWSPTSD